MAEDIKTPETATPDAVPLPFEVYGVSGKMGSGKDYVALNMLKPALGPDTLILCFADHFKIDACSKQGVPFDKVFGSGKDDETRKLLQQMGTEQGRKRYGDNIWLETLEVTMRMHASRGIKQFIICDVRFKNEVAWIRKLGGKIVRLQASERTWLGAMREAKNDEAKAKDRLTHISEVELDSMETLDVFDAIIHNDIGEEEQCKEEMALFVNRFVKTKAGG
jgi:phosphomevalonate kinase